jgi:hypothetical protein
MEIAKSTLLSRLKCEIEFGRLSFRMCHSITERRAEREM